MATGNPILDTSRAPQSPFFEKPAQSAQPSSETKRIIAELGLRFPPASRQDQEERAGLLALLARDVADEKPAVLSVAAVRWAKVSRFMPKASELIELCRTIELEIEIQNRTSLPAPVKRNEEDERPSPPLSREELQRMVDASPSSLSGQFFAMGLNAGYIEDVGGGLFRERGGMFTVSRTPPREFAA